MSVEKLLEELDDAGLHTWRCSTNEDPINSCDCDAPKLIDKLRAALQREDMVLVPREPTGVIMAARLGGK